jgi:hypothetical protein
MLTGTALAIGAAATAGTFSQAAAQQKTSQSAVQYQGTPRSGQRCEDCANFQPPNACRTVQGDISSNGWCMLFSPKA